LAGTISMNKHELEGTTANLHWIHCELSTFKRIRNKRILHTNWCEIHSPDLWSFRWSKILWLS